MNYREHTPEPGAIFPPAKEVNQAYTEMVTQSQAGSGFGNILSAVFEATVEANDVISFDENDNLVDRDEQQSSDEPAAVYGLVRESLRTNKAVAEMHNELHGVVNEDLFARIGIKMLPTGGYMSDGVEAVTAASLEPHLESVSLFTEYISLLDPEGATGSSLLDDVAGGLKERIDLTIGEPERAEIGMDAIRAWIELETEYERLGIETYSTSSLREYPHYWAQNVLPEFIEATSNGYVELDGKEFGFGPADWAMDMSPEGLLDSWGKAIDCMSATGMKNPESDLYSAMREHLASCLNRSIGSMEKSLADLGTKEDAEAKIVAWKAEHGDVDSAEVPDERYGRVITSAPTLEQYDYSVAYASENLAALKAAQERFSKQ